jgi:hypothetical protein
MYARRDMGREFNPVGEVELDRGVLWRFVRGELDEPSRARFEYLLEPSCFSSELRRVRDYEAIAERTAGGVGWTECDVERTRNEGV